VITYLIWIIASMIISESLWRVSYPLLVLSYQVCISIFFMAWYIVAGHDTGLVIVFIVSSMIIGILLLSSLDALTIRKIIKRLRAV
jgi:hypothetical protein